MTASDDLSFMSDLEHVRSELLSLELREAMEKLREDEALRNMQFIQQPSGFHDSIISCWKLTVLQQGLRGKVRKRLRWKRRRKLRRMLRRRRRLVLPKLVRYPWPELVSSSSESLPELIDSEG